MERQELLRIGGGVKGVVVVGGMNGYCFWVEYEK